MKTCKLIIKDYVNVKFEGVDILTREAVNKALKFTPAWARHSPKYKMKRWDGKIAFATVGGWTYINLLDIALEIVMGAGYEVDVVDQRPDHDFVFPEIDEYFLSEFNHPPDHHFAGEPIVLMDHQVEAVNKFLKNPSSLECLATSSGKCQPYYAKIKTPTGWTTMGEIKVGDEVMTPKGTIAKVLNVYDPGSKDVYEITFEDGRKTHSCEDHIWRVHSHSWKMKKNEWRDMSLREINEKLPTAFRGISIPLVSMKEDNNDVDLSINPYMMGALLGDGSFRNAITITTKDDHIKNKIEMNLVDGYRLRPVGKYGFHFCFESKTKMNEMKSSYLKGKDFFTAFDDGSYHYYRNELRQHGLDMKLSHEKFIPEKYLNGSYTQRLELIRGLMDTDGYVDKRGCLEYTTTSKRLIEDFVYAIRSVGGMASVREKIPTFTYKGEKKKGKVAYTASIYHETPEILVTLPRKLERIEKRIVRAHPNLHFKNIEKVSHEPVRCIMIDDEDHLYVTDDFVVTHNTIICSVLSKVVEKHTGGRMIIVVPSVQLVRQTEQDYKNIDLDVGVYFGDEKNYSNKHIITTWQSLHVLAEAAKDDQEAADRLRLLLDGVVAIMIDEAHGIKGQSLMNLLVGPFANIPLRWGLTGTIPKDEYDWMCLYSTIGDVVHTVTAKELQDLGLISNCHIDILKLNDSHVEFSDYTAERDFIFSDKERIQWMLDYCQELSKKGNTLVLVDSIELGKKLSKMVPGSFFIYGNVKTEKRIEEFKKMGSQDNNLLFASFATCSTGISAVRIFNLVFIGLGKSFTTTLQSIGRGLRKGKDKNFINIYDISSSLKFASRHLSVRKSYYKEAQYPFVEHKIKYR